MLDYYFLLILPALLSKVQYGSYKFTYFDIWAFDIPNWGEKKRQGKKKKEKPKELKLTD